MKSKKEKKKKKKGGEEKKDIRYSQWSPEQRGRWGKQKRTPEERSFSFPQCITRFHRPLRVQVKCKLCFTATPRVFRASQAGTHTNWPDSAQSWTSGQRPNLPVIGNKGIQECFIVSTDNSTGKVLDHQCDSFFLECSDRKPFLRQQRSR